MHNHLKRWTLCICLSMALITVLTGCGKFSITGRVVNGADGVGLSDVTIEATSGSAVSTKTDADGYWTLGELKGTVNIKARKMGWTFNGPFIVDKSAKGQSVNFTGTQNAPETYEVSGRVVKDYDGTGLGGVSVSFSGGLTSVTTDGNGDWSRSGLSGTVTVSIAKDGWTFDSTSQTVSAASTSVNFTALSYRLSGRVTRSNDDPVAGVTMNLTGGYGSTQTDVNGNWLVSGLQYTVTVTPVKDEWIFSPASRQYTGAASDGNFIAMTVVQFIATKVNTGACHTIALKNDGTVWAWGDNEFGQLGDGTATHRRTPVQVSGLSGVTTIAAGGGHTVALKNDGTVWAWGLNGDGQLGDGTTTDRSTPVQVSGLSDVTTIAAGGSHTVALKNDGTVWAWGYNYYGSLGDGTTTARSTPMQVSGLSGVTTIAAGAGHTVALKNDGTVWAWGFNYWGQLGDGTTDDRYTPVQVSGLSGVTTIAAGWRHTVALKNDGTVWAWGDNEFGQLGDGTATDRFTPVQVSGLSGVTTIAAWWSHTVTLKNDGTVWAWGQNNCGQLGDGTTTNRYTPVQVSGLSNVTAIAAGFQLTVALKNDGTVWAWGYNCYGQLGDDTTTDRSTPVQVFLIQ